MKKTRTAIIGMVLAVVPFFGSCGLTQSERVNGELVSYSQFDVLGVVAAVVAIGIAIGLTRHTEPGEPLAKWRLMAAAIGLVAVLQVLHATELVKEISPCTSDRPDNSWCRYQP